MGAGLTHYFYIICILGHCFIREFGWLFIAHNDFFLEFSHLIFGFSRGPVFNCDRNSRHHPAGLPCEHHLALCLPFIPILIKLWLLPLCVPNPDCSPNSAMDLDFPLYAYTH